LSVENELRKALCKTLAEIAEKEKRKAVQKGEYMNAIFASFAETFLRQAERSSD
jgi:hypothetical protein